MDKLETFLIFFAMLIKPLKSEKKYNMGFRQDMSRKGWDIPNMRVCPNYLKKESHIFYQVIYILAVCRSFFDQIFPLWTD